MDLKVVLALISVSIMIATSSGAAAPSATGWAAPIAVMPDAASSSPESDVAQASIEPGMEPQAEAKYPEWDTFPEHAKTALTRAADPNIADMLTKINMTDVQTLFADLESRSKPNRLTGTQRYLDATDWIKGVLNSRAPRLDVEYQEWGNYRNIVISLKGDGSTSDWYEVGGHYDSVAAGPGMDDDGSGSLGSAIIALAMSQYNFQANVRFLLFDAEESGLIGSNHYVQGLKTTCPPRSCLKYYINMDMMAYDPNNARAFYVNTDKTYIQVLHEQVAADYGLGITVRRGGQSGCNTDHCYYDRNGYDSSADDEVSFSRCYHQACDLIAEFNWETFHRTLKTVAGVLATSAGMIGKAGQGAATTLTVTPENASLDLSKTLQFRARGYDVNGTPAPLPSPVQWNASGGVISSNGVYTPAGVGNYTITATSGNLTDSTTVMVIPSALVRIEVLPDLSDITEDQTLQLNATGYDGNGLPAIPQPTFLWNVTPGGTITKTGLFTPAGAGYYIVEAKAGSFTDTADVRVSKVVLSRLQISTTDSDCTTSGTVVECEVTSPEILLFAEAWDQAGLNLNWKRINDGAKVAWNVTPPDFGAVRQDWSFSTDKLGKARFQGTAYGLQSNLLEVEFVPGAMASLKLMPEADQAVEVGRNLQFSFVAKDSKNNSLPEKRITAKYALNPSDIGSVDAKGMFTAAKKGKGKVALEAIDTRTQTKLTDDTVVDVTGGAQPPPGPAPPIDISGMAIPLVAIIALVAVALAAMMLMRKKRKDTVKGEVPSAAPTVPGTAPAAKESSKASEKK